MDRAWDRVAPGAVLAVGDPRRRVLGRTALATLVALGAFVLFTVPTKQLKPLYAHAPWQDDPYDTVYSFAMFLVLLVAGVLLVSVSLCRKVEPLPLVRARTVLRACRVGTLLMGATLASCWIGIALGSLGSHRAEWQVPSTGVLVGGLSLSTLTWFWAPRGSGEDRSSGKSTRLRRSNRTGSEMPSPRCSTRPGGSGRPDPSSSEPSA